RLDRRGEQLGALTEQAADEPGDLAHAVLADVRGTGDAEGEGAGDEGATAVALQGTQVGGEAVLEHAVADLDVLAGGGHDAAAVAGAQARLADRSADDGIRDTRDGQRSGERNAHAVVLEATRGIGGGADQR